MNELSIDFETRSLVDIKDGAWRYSEDPSTSVLCMSYQFPGGKPQLWWGTDPFPEDVAQWLADGKPIRAWNAEFEVAIFTNVLRKKHGLARILPSQVYCTQAEALAMSLPAKLEDAAKALGLPEDQQKAKEGKRLIQYLCRPWKGAFREDPERLRAIGAYCQQDVVTETAVARKLRRLDPAELRLFRRNMKMNAKGLPIDTHRAAMMDRRYAEMKTEAIETCKAITGGISPTQVKLFTPWCGLENMQKKTVERAIRDGHPQSEALKCRQVASNVSLAKLRAIPRLVCKDHTLKGLFKFHAATTGRWASQGGFNAQNLPRGTIELDEIHDCLETIPTLEPHQLVSLLRSVFTFPMSVVDYSQIETRMLLWLSDDQLGLDEFRQGLDPYKTMAMTIYQVHYEEVTKFQRQIGKSAVLGAGYQLGAAGFVSYCDAQDITIGLEGAVEVIDAFRRKYKKVKATWGRCKDAAVSAISNPGKAYRAARSTFVVKAGYLWIILPSGRRICYKSPWLTPPPTGDEWKGQQINYWGRDRYTRQWSKQTTYGGSIFQSITQGSARDVMADAMLRMWDEDLDVRGVVHDEVICLGDVQEQMTEIMLQNPAWCLDLPIGVDGWTGNFYRK